MVVPEDFANPGEGPDYRIGSDGLAQDNGWRVATPPFAEDGSVPDTRLLMADSIYPNVPATGGGYPWFRRESTRDLPIG